MSKIDHKHLIWHWNTEYGVTTWFPYKVKDIEIIESVQKRATKQVKATGVFCVVPICGLAAFPIR